MTLPPDSPITPVTACTMPGRSGQDRVTTSCAFSVIGVSLARFIPANEAGAPFGGDATGLRGVVELLRAGLPLGRVPPRFHARFTSRQGQHASLYLRLCLLRCQRQRQRPSFTCVSRMKHPHSQPNTCGHKPEPAPNLANRHNRRHVNPLGGSLNPPGGTLNPSMRTLTP